MEFIARFIPVTRAGNDDPAPVGLVMRSGESANNPLIREIFEGSKYGGEGHEDSEMVEAGA